MSYECEWDDCLWTSDDFEVFYDHVKTHNPVTSRNLEGTDEICGDCKWRDCFADGFETELELTAHILFHAYHAKLKNLGLKAQIKAELAPCALDPQARNLVPEFPELFTCLWESCDLVTECPKTFYRHVDGHVGSTVKESARDIVSCKWRDCNFSSVQRFKLKEHCRTHTQEKTFSCPTCGGLFANKTKFTDHLRRQNTMESESYQCSHCLKYCASERILRDHMRHHINNVKCPYCDMTCPTQSALQNHMTFRHSNEKPHACDMCEASFKMLNDLRRHQQLHNPLYSYTCEVEGCDYAAKAYQSLKRHYRTWHEDPGEAGKYECHICKSRYSRGTNLTSHLKKYHKFRWPAGHKRFRYKEDSDGIYRLQTVRFETVELSQQLDASQTHHDDTETEISTNEDNVIECTTRDLSNHAADVSHNESYLELSGYGPTENGSDSSSCVPTTAMAPFSQSQESSIIAFSSASQESFRNVLDHLRRQCEHVEGDSSIEPEISSHIPTSNFQSIDESQAANEIYDSSVDLQEAVTLLTMLRNSGM